MSTIITTDESGKSITIFGLEARDGIEPAYAFGLAQKAIPDAYCRGKTAREVAMTTGESIDAVLFATELAATLGKIESVGLAEGRALLQTEENAELTKELVVYRKVDLSLIQRMVSSLLNACGNPYHKK